MPEASEKLFEEVLSDARTKADRARRRGDRDAEAARRKAAREADARAEELLKAARGEAEMRARQIMATLEIEAQRERLARLEENLQAVYDAALAQLNRLDESALGEAEVRLALNGIEQVPDSAVELSLPGERHAARVQSLAEEVGRRAAEAGRDVRVAAAERPADIARGVVVRSADGRVEVVNALDERLRRLWGELRLEAAVELFPEQVQGKEA